MNKIMAYLSDTTTSSSLQFMVHSRIIRILSKPPKKDILNKDDSLMYISMPWTPSKVTHETEITDYQSGCTSYKLKWSIPSTCHNTKVWAPTVSDMLTAYYTYARNEVSLILVGIPARNQLRAGTEFCDGLCVNWILRITELDYVKTKQSSLYLSKYLNI